MTILRGAGVINEDQGKVIDGIHEQYKNANPEYGKRGRQIGCQNE